MAQWANKRTLAVLASAAILGALALLSVVKPAEAVAPDPNPWLTDRFLVMAHQGGEDEAPSSTLFAFKSAMRDRGADSLELDVNLSSDGQLMVIHDDTVNRTTQETRDRASGFSEVNDLTAAQIQALDAAYTFRPGHYDKSEPASAYPYRGIRTGDKPPPPGYAADDFAIPTLQQVLDAFPHTPINIEIKMIKTTTGTAGGCVMDGGQQYCDDPTASMPVADALAALLDQPQYASRTDLLVVSFSDDLISEFHSKDVPPYVALAPGTAGILLAAGGLTPTPDVAAFQVPPQSGTIKVPELLLNKSGADVHSRGYAVHVWTNGDQDETDASYRHLYDLGVDGIMTSDPSRLAAFLCANDIPRPDGTPRCTHPGSPPASQQHKRCKKKHKSARKKRAAASKHHKCKKKHKHKRKHH